MTTPHMMSPQEWVEESQRRTDAGQPITALGFAFEPQPVVAPAITGVDTRSTFLPDVRLAGTPPEYRGRHTRPPSAFWKAP